MGKIHNSNNSKVKGQNYSNTRNGIQQILYQPNSYIRTKFVIR